MSGFLDMIDALAPIATKILLRFFTEKDCSEKRESAPDFTNQIPY